MLPAKRNAVKHTEFSTPESLPPTNGYSHVASVPPGSRLVWTSGQVPLKADGTAASGDWEVQTRLAMRNVGVALAEAGASWNDVFKLTIFVVDTSALDVVRSVRDEFVNLEHPPTSSLVQVAGLVRTDILVEIEAVAAVSVD
jgi:enamine deaminase RidA (YjgF/YER057c/UK114 family)